MRSEILVPQGVLNFGLGMGELPDGQKIGAC